MKYVIDFFLSLFLYIFLFKYILTSQKVRLG